MAPAVGLSNMLHVLRLKQRERAAAEAELRFHRLGLAKRRKDVLLYLTIHTFRTQFQYGVLSSSSDTF